MININLNLVDRNSKRFLSTLPASIKTVYRVQNWTPQKVVHGFLWAYNLKIIFYHQIRTFKNISWLYDRLCTHSWCCEKTFPYFNDNRVKVLTPPLKYLLLLLIKKVCIAAYHCKDNFRAWISIDGQKMIFH